MTRQVEVLVRILWIGLTGIFSDKAVRAGQLGSLRGND